MCTITMYLCKKIIQSYKSQILLHKITLLGNTYMLLHADITYRLVCFVDITAIFHLCMYINCLLLFEHVHYTYYSIVDGFVHFFGLTK